MGVGRSTHSCSASDALVAQGCERCVAAVFRDARVFCLSREGAFIFRDKWTIGYYTKKIEIFPNDLSIGIVARRLKS